jgi:hypothetical protein
MKPGSIDENNKNNNILLSGSEHGTSGSGNVVVKPSQSFITSCQVSSTISKGFTSQTSTILPENFILTDNDVLCGRGSKCFNHPGNQKFRKIVDNHLHKYTNTMCKYDKSAIICEVVNEVRTNSPNGGFVKYDSEANRYFEVGDFLAVRYIFLKHTSFFLYIDSIFKKLTHSFRMCFFFSFSLIFGTHVIKKNTA